MLRRTSRSRDPHVGKGPISGPATLESPDKVSRHSQACDVSMQPSVSDGLPNSVVESKACGRIVLARDSGGIPKVMNHGVDGL